VQPNRSNGDLLLGSRRGVARFIVVFRLRGMSDGGQVLCRALHHQVVVVAVYLATLVLDDLLVTLDDVGTQTLVAVLLVYSLVFGGCESIEMSVVTTAELDNIAHVALTSGVVTSEALEWARRMVDIASNEHRKRVIPSAKQNRRRALSLNVYVCVAWRWVLEELHC
jgi:hypothetical protein